MGDAEEILCIHQFYDEILTQSMSDPFNRGEAHVFGMIFQTGDGGFFRFGALGKDFLGNSRPLAGLPQENAHLEFLVAALKVFGESFVGAFAPADVCIKVVFHRLVFRFR